MRPMSYFPYDKDLKKKAQRNWGQQPRNKKKRQLLFPGLLFTFFFQESKYTRSTKVKFVGADNFNYHSIIRIHIFSKFFRKSSFAVP